MTGPDQVATEMDYAIPEESGSVLITPPPDQVAGLLRAAREATWGNAEVLGVPLAEFRRRVRERALVLAAVYTRSRPSPGDLSSPGGDTQSGAGRPQGGDTQSGAGRQAGWPAGEDTQSGAGRQAAARPPAEQPVILMGHQPVFFHPGVWMKFFLLNRLAAEHGATGVHLIVDTDATGPITAEIPAGGEPLVRVSEALTDIPDETPLEVAPLPAPEVWAAFVRRVGAHLATLPSPEFGEHLKQYAAGEAEARRAAGTLAEFLAGLRRRYEARAGSCGYLELPVSRLADTAEFRAFALHLLQSPDELRRIYNSSLDDYRRLHRLRSQANPFPNLTEGGGRVETPFWVVRGGTRADLFAARHGLHLELATADGPIATIPAGAAGIDALAAAGVVLRPKAMTLTLFARLCLGDLFIHGVSGGRYDRVTDVIGERLFGRRPPAYMVATATLYPALLTGAEVAEQRRALERRAMDLRHNPDRHLASPSDPQRRLVDEKWTLIRAVETMRPGPDRRAATRRIREVNELLAGALASEIATLEAKLATLHAAQDAASAARYRGYAFFVFAPAEVRALAAPAPLAERPPEA